MTTKIELKDLFTSVESARLEHHPEIDGTMLHKVVEIEIEFQDDEVAAMRVIGELIDQAVASATQGEG